MTKKLYIAIPCWGTKYIEKFLRFSLPCLLAPGNIPSVSKTSIVVIVNIYSEPGSFPTFTESPVFKLLQDYTTVNLIDVNRFNSEYQKDSVTLFSMSHEDTLIQAAQNEDMAMFLCSDTFINGSGIQFLVDKVAQGYECVLNSASRINFESCIGKLNSKRMDQFIDFTAPEMVQILVDSLHKDESDMARPGNIAAKGWPGLCAWYLQGVGYLKHTFYYNPSIVVAKSNMSFGGATFDSSEMMNVLCENWNKVYIVQDANEFIILDLADEHEQHLPIEEGYRTPFDFALNFCHWNIPDWQHKVFQSSCTYIVPDRKPLFIGMLEEAKGFMENFYWWRQQFEQNPQALPQERWNHISKLYQARLGINSRTFESAVKDLNKDFIGKKVCFYGVGDFCEFILRQYKFSNIEVIVSDSNDDKLSEFCFGYKTRRCEELSTSVDVVIPMSLQFESEMKSSIIDRNRGHVEVKVVDWKKYVHNQKAHSL